MTESNKNTINYNCDYKVMPDGTKKCMICGDKKNHDD